MDGSARSALTRGATWRAALGLALGAAVSLGLARFSYALLLPPMRADLGWSYFTAGSMNTMNAVGYLAGALLMPALLARFSARALMLASGAAAAALLAAHGLVRSDAALLALRGASGVASAASFVCGGLLAARLGALAAPSSAAAPGSARLPGAGLILGLYYGGIGLGIIASALLVPPLTEAARDAWPHAWWALGALAALATTGLGLGTRPLQAPPTPRAAGGAAWPWPRYAAALGGYLMFGLGYIGYMTFIVTLLREQGMARGTVTAFYLLLGAGVVASSWLWAGLLQRHRGGWPMALLNGLLALATALPVFSSQPLAVFASGLLFGSVFVSVVASTTALVRHNAPASQWAGGIAAFTIIFAAGQIVGPSVVGAVADATGGGAAGLVRGLGLSAAALALGSLLGALQRPLR